MKATYQFPRIELLKLTSEDIIVTGSVTNGGSGTGDNITAEELLGQLGTRSYSF